MLGDTTKKEVIKTEGLFGHKRRGEELEISELFERSWQLMVSYGLYIFSLF